MRPAACSTRPRPGTTLTENTTGLPLTTDGNAAWLTARTGNGVFVSSAGSSVQNATIDAGRVSNPSALTASTYTLQFSASGSTTTYAVLKDGAATAVTAAPYASGQAITVDGMSVAVSGAPATGDQFTLAPSTPTLSVFGTLDQAIAGLQTTGRTSSQIAQANANGLRDIDSAMNNLRAARAPQARCSTGSTPRRAGSTPRKSPARASERMRKMWTWCTPSPIFRTSKAATMRRSSRTRWSSACRCSST